MEESKEEVEGQFVELGLLAPVAVPPTFPLPLALPQGEDEAMALEEIDKEALLLLETVSVL